MVTVLNSVKKALGILVLISLLSRLLGDKLSIPHVWNAPSENLNFVGRGEFLKRIETIFNQDQGKITVLYGPPGFGKTQIAKRYTYTHYPNYDFVW